MACRNSVQPQPMPSSQTLRHQADGPVTAENEAVGDTARNGLLLQRHRLVVAGIWAVGVCHKKNSSVSGWRSCWVRA